jgi:hypothetical protein
MVLSWYSKNCFLTKRSTRLDLPTALSPSSTSLNWNVLPAAPVGPAEAIAALKPDTRVRSESAGAPTARQGRSDGAPTLPLSLELSRATLARPRRAPMAAVAAAVRAVRQQVPHACLYIDFPWGELPHALRLLRGEPASEAQRAAAAAEVEALWGGPGALATLSVRTAFHLFLLAKRWPPGSEVIVSAINIPDMSSLLRHHGLRIVPLDVDVLTLAPRVDLVDALVTPHTRALLVAHLFGRRFDVAPLAAAARRLNLTLIEDSAEAFCGAEYRGHPLADISMFSFGTIKTGTSFGGALSRVRDEAVLQAMRRAHEGTRQPGRVSSPSSRTHPRARRLPRAAEHAVCEKGGAQRGGHGDSQRPRLHRSSHARGARAGHGCQAVHGAHDARVRRRRGRRRGARGRHQHAALRGATRAARASPRRL